MCIDTGLGGFDIFRPHASVVKSRIAIEGLRFGAIDFMVHAVYDADVDIAVTPLYRDRRFGDIALSAKVEVAWRISDAVDSTNKSRFGDIFSRDVWILIYGECRREVDGIGIIFRIVIIVCHGAAVFAHCGNLE
ncbi:hypothetical protein D3C81_1823620 [compost metagenome]